MFFFFSFIESFSNMRNLLFILKTFNLFYVFYYCYLKQIISFVLRRRWCVVKLFPSIHGILTSIFQASLSLRKIPTLWKMSIVVPVPKKSRPASPNDFRPIALTSHVMKSFEKIIKTIIMTRTEHLSDSLNESVC